MKTPLSAKGREGARRTPFFVKAGRPEARSGLGASSRAPTRGAPTGAFEGEGGVDGGGRSRAPTRGAPTGIGEGSVEGVGHGWRVDLGTHEGCPYGY